MTSGYYRIAHNFGGKKYWQIWQMKCHRTTFSPPIILTNLLEGMRQNCNT